MTPKPNKISTVVTIRDVAEAAGVSTTMVSMVLNARRGPQGEYLCSASAATAKRVVDAAARLGYKRNLAASSLRSGKSHIIGVIVPDILNAFFGAVCKRIEKLASESGYLALMGSTDENVEKMRTLVENFVATGVDGLIIAPCAGSEDIIREISAKGIPVVLMDRDIPSLENVSRVMLDNEKAGRMAARHLIDNGYKAIEFITYETNVNTLPDRVTGYRKEMEESGLSSRCRVDVVRHDNLQEDIIDVLKGARERGSEAVILSSSILTLSGIAAINKLSYSIPDDIAVVGFDQEGRVELFSSRISFIYQPASEVAGKTLNLLKIQIEGVDEWRTEIINPVFISGESSRSSKSIRSDSVLLFGSSFDEKGGWISDPQFFEMNGTSCLLAHGLGIPVKDASTLFRVSRSGRYYVHVHTRNWTAYWSDKPTPGIFRISIDGETMPALFGTGDPEWYWQDGGYIDLEEGNHRISVHDLTGFEGRFDAIMLSLNPGIPVEGIQTLRNRLLCSVKEPEDYGKFDFVVVGGGVAGMCAAIAAARLGQRVALVQDRKVLGGNNSSEVRVGLGGRLNVGPFPSLGYLLNEFGPSRKGNARTADVYEDEKKLNAILKEKNITLLLGYRVTSVIKSDARRIAAVVATDVDSYREVKISGHYFADCTGDAVLGVVAGADWAMGREAKSEYGEPSAPDKADGITLGASVQWYSEECDSPQDFPDIDWGLEITEETVQKVRRGQWYWEVGMIDDQIRSNEKIRDYGMYVAYSNWSYIKNHASFRDEYANTRLGWLSYYAGKRESRRLLGEFVLKEQDLRNFVIYPDGCVATSWYIDNHEPDLENARHYKDPWLSRGCLTPLDFYPIPFRCFYSRSISNLFMAGRDISVSHLALGTTRVMRTCAMMGEVIGMACAVCKENGIDPSEIWPGHFDELKDLMNRGVGNTNLPYMQVYTLIDTTAARDENC